MFALHKTLAADTHPIIEWDLSHVRLMKDANYPWLILIPARTGIEGIHQLTDRDRGLLMQEIQRASETLETVFQPDRINVAALGNVVEQLHVHVIARFQSDPAWPAPVWGTCPRVEYEQDDLQEIVATIKKAFDS